MTSWNRALYNNLAGEAAVVAAAVANSATQSAAVDLGRKRLLGIFFPASFEGTKVTFQAAETLTGTYVNVLDTDGAAYEALFTDPGYVPIDPLKFVGVQFLKVTSDVAMTGANSLNLSVG